MTPGGRVPIYVGRSSRDIELTGGISVPAAQEVVLPRGPITGIGGKCVDVAGGSSANGTPVQLFDCNGTRRAALERRPPTARSRRSASASTWPAAATANGTAVQLYECNGTGAQQWMPGADGTLRNPQSGRCLDAAGGSPPTAHG